MKTEEILTLVMSELSRAEEIHPIWSDDIVRAAAIVSEEAGELVQIVNTFDAKPDTTPKTKIVIEAVQTAASAIRFLKNFNNK